uniref:Uncharacterized protein n=1 Tax=viral metagenome TaxID=1070528 RepID=A0A6C0B016_9ZZZZ
MYPNTLVTAKKKTIYKTYLFSNSLETELGNFIYTIVYLVKKN